jgi:superfamily I DNA/RNA helicase
VSDLNIHQRKSVEEEGHLQVNACPGSGKTTVLSKRAGYLLQKYPDGNLMAATFTSDAADELKSRILAAAPFAERRIAAGTFHSLALLQLRRAGYKINLLSTREINSMIDSIQDELPQEDQIKSQVIGEMLSAIQSATKPDNHPYVVKNKVMAYIWDRYKEHKQNKGKMDFADLLYMAVAGMKDGTVQPYNIRWLLADEYQDADEVQHDWVLCHANNPNCETDVTVVADDDQSIYGFRAASGYEGMMRSKQELNAKSVVLPVNYRCGAKILNAAAKLIEMNNPNRIDKPIEAGLSFDGMVADPIICSYDGREGVLNKSQPEFETVTERILEEHHRLQGQSDYSGEWAILARGNNALNAIERYLMSLNVAYTRKSGSFWDIPVVADYLAVLNYLTRNEWFGFAVYLGRILKVNWVYEQDTTSITGLLEKAESRGYPVIAKSLKHLASFEQEWREWIADGDAGNPLSYKDCLEDIAQYMAKQLRGRAKTKEKNAIRLMDAASILASRNEKTLIQRISAVTTPYKPEGLVNKRKQAALANGEPHVDLMTMHASKGLEFENVFIVQCETGTFDKETPSGMPTDIREERRLFYVSITRAKRRLFTSLSGQNKDVAGSLFLKEAGIIE